MLTPDKRKAAAEAIAKVHPDWPQGEVRLAIEMMPTAAFWVHPKNSPEYKKHVADFEERRHNYLNWVLSPTGELPSVRLNQRRRK